MNHARTTKTTAAVAITDYHFHDLNWLWEALQATESTVTVIGNRTVPEGNRMLALLGDRLMCVFIVATGVGNNLTSGGAKALINQLLGKDRLVGLCDSLGLTACINVNSSAGQRVSAHTKLATVKAVVAAVYQDGGIDAAEGVARHLGII